MTPVVAPPPPPPLPEPTKEAVALANSSDTPADAIPQETTIPNDETTEPAPRHALPPPPSESEESTAAPAPKQEFWTRLSRFLNLGKKAPAPSDTTDQGAAAEAAANNGVSAKEMAAAESEAVAESPETPASLPDETTNLQAPDPWAPKVILTREKARMKGVYSIVSPKTPTPLPMPPVKQEVAVSIDAPPAAPAAEPVVGPPTEAAPDGPATPQPTLPARAEDRAEESGKKDQVAQSSGPRLPLIALPDRQFFSQLGAFLLRRKGEADQRSSSTAEAEEIAKSFGRTGPDELRAETVGPPAAEESGVSSAPDGSVAEPDDNTAEKTEEQETANLVENRPPLPSLSDRTAAEPASRPLLAIPPAARTMATESAPPPAPAAPPSSDSERATDVAARPDPEAEAVAVPDMAEPEKISAEEDEDSAEEDEDSAEDSLFAKDEDSAEEDEDSAEGSLFSGEDDSETKKNLAERAEDDEPESSSDGEITQAEESEEESGPFAQILGKWAEFFAGAGARSAVVVNQALDPIPEAAAAETSRQDPRGEGPWQATDVQVAGLTAPGRGEPLHAFPPQAALAGVRLALGKSVRLGVLPRGRRDDPQFRRRCIEKKRRTVIFCVIPVDWPKNMKPYFLVGSVLYDGTQAIVRYDDERATFYHALFESDAFEKVVAYYRKRLGLPTESWVRRMVVMAAAARPNPTVLWRSVESATNLVTILEIRKYDDARGGFPDTKRGAILLYHTWSSPIFPEVSHLELMMVR